MLSEKEIIATVNECLPSGKGRLSTPHSHDAEVCLFNGDRVLFTTDEFSDEDLFPDQPPFILGWNIAAGAISDIIATGGHPEYYAHALTIGSNWDVPYLKEFCRGVSKVLGKYGVTFIGGDAGKSEKYRCTASVVGKPIRKSVGRSGASSGDFIFSSGGFGGGNVNAAISLYGGKGPLSGLSNVSVVKFHILYSYASLIAQFASSCIDTSDGFFRSLETIAERNNLGYFVEKIPLLKRGIVAAKIVSLPVSLLFFAECGEYELLFTVPQKKVQDMYTVAKKVHCAPLYIGKMVSQPDKRQIHFGKSRFNGAAMNINGRDFADPKDYLREVTLWIHSNR